MRLIQKIRRKNRKGATNEVTTNPMVKMQSDTNNSSIMEPDDIEEIDDIEDEKSVSIAQYNDKLDQRCGNYVTGLAVLFCVAILI